MSKTIENNKYYVRLGATGRILRNFFIGIFSAGWVSLLGGGIRSLANASSLLLEYSYRSKEQQDADLLLKNLFVHSRLGISFISMSLTWLAIVIIFWAFVASSKIWPAKRSKNT